MINKLLYKLSNVLPCRIITVNGEPYLERYYITSNIFLHRFISGDGDRHIHDHPWKWAFSLILLGGYVEEIQGNLPLVKRRWFNWIGPKYFHRITSVSPQTWTLFVHGDKIKGWGFLEHDGNYQPAANAYVRIKNGRPTYPIGRNTPGRAGL